VALVAGGALAGILAYKFVIAPIVEMTVAYLARQAMLDAVEAEVDQLVAEIYAYLPELEGALSECVAGPVACEAGLATSAAISVQVEQLMGEIADIEEQALARLSSDQPA
jgi:hypothetical protein